MNKIPNVGAQLRDGGIQFDLWAPEAKNVRIEIIDNENNFSRNLDKQPHGFWCVFIPNLTARTLYRYFLDGQGPFPDPASSFQPQGVHGPSQVIDHTSFEWTDHQWYGRLFKDLIFYEIHIGTFTPEGTFQAAAKKLSYLKDLGITAIEIMPVAEFPGRRNWGYDGVSLFAPSRNYGSPDDFKNFVNLAHAEGLSVFLDVVYNHLGPDGNYLSQFSPYYFTNKHKTPWGDALNFDGENNRPVRDFFISNAQYWVQNFHLDGLRLDATHAIFDERPQHIVAEITEHVKNIFPLRPVHVVAEDHRNLSVMVTSSDKGGWGLDGVWADDLHHSIRRCLAGDSEGYYQDYAGTLEEIATNLRQGWLFTGQPSQYLGEKRGTLPQGIPLEKFVVCLQNHDQIGNRAMGERLHHQIDLPTYRAASVLLLTALETPLLFMGQEWAARSPFQYFTDHNEELGKLVTQGRREEFKKFSSFTDPVLRGKIPDPQRDETFIRSQLQWDELQSDTAMHIRQLYKDLLHLRNVDLTSFRVKTCGKNVLATLRSYQDKPHLLTLINLKGEEQIKISKEDSFFCSHEIPFSLDLSKCELLLSTEDGKFCHDPHPIEWTLSSIEFCLRFKRPGAIVLKLF